MLGHDVCNRRSRVGHIHVYVQGRSEIQAIPVWAGSFQDCPGHTVWAPIRMCYRRFSSYAWHLGVFRVDY